MGPASKMLIFLVAALGIFVILGPHGAASGSDAGAVYDCTLGSCPAVIEPSANGKVLSYPLGTKITFPAARKAAPAVECSRPEVLTPVLDSGAENLAHSAAWRAENRGVCSLSAGGIKVTVLVSRFR